MQVKLTPTEYEVLKRWPPVRRAGNAAHRRGILPPEPKPAHCRHCGRPATGENPLQICHRIPFLKGIIEGGYTPDYLNRPDNLIWAHRTGCNKAVEVPKSQWA